MNSTVYPLLGWHLIHYGIKGFRDDGTAFLQDSPLGVKLAVEKADCSPPVLYPDQPWEHGGLNHFRLVREGDLLRLWYASGEHLCYAESKDGTKWERPALNQISVAGSAANNICFTGKGAPWGFGWFEDKDAKPEQRFKFIALVAWWEDEHGTEVPEETVVAHQQSAASQGIRPPQFSIRWSMQGFVSPDRFHWRQLDATSLMDIFSDTQPVVWYDPSSKLYRGYFRTTWAGRRAVGYSETPDFERWPLPKVVLHGSPEDGPDTDVYTNCYCPYPGQPNLHLLFPAMYHHNPDTVDVHLAMSLDGLDWTRPSFQPIIPLGEFDGLPEQSLYASPDLVSLPEGHWGLMYLSCVLPHNAYPHQFRIPAGKRAYCYRWARWKPHRLVGITAEQVGQFTIRRQPLSAGEIRINYRTAPGGWIRVELAEKQGGYPPSELPPLPNYTFDLCDTLEGDETDRRVTWKGSGDLSTLVGRSVAIRVRLFRATIFAVSL